MRKSLFIVLSLCFGLKVFSQSTSYDKTFEGFKIMALPREALPIGALWNLSMGPTGGGVSSDFLQVSKSYTDFSTAVNKDFSNSINLGLLNFVKSNGTYNSISKVDFKVEDVSIVTLNSNEVLKNSIGQYILYEAIKVDKVSTIIEKNKELEVKAELNKLFKDLDITNATENETQKKLELKGVNLFIAYRVVKIEKVKTSQQKLKFSSQGYSTASYIKLSSTYAANTKEVTVELCPCSIQNCMIESSKISEKDYESLLAKCAVEKGFDVTVVLKNRINMKTGTPEEFKFKIYSTPEIRNVNKPLYSITTSEGLEVAYLNVERIIFSPINSALVYMLHDKDYRKASIITTKFKTQNFIPNSVAGW